MGIETLYLLTNSRCAPAIHLYEKLGFVAFGDEFEEGGMPHRAMKTY